MSVFLHGQTDLRLAAVDSSTVLAKYDLVWLDTDDVKPASDFDWDSGGLADTQALFAAAFLGVCLTKSEDGDTDEVTIDISDKSVYEFSAASGTYEIGAPLGPDEDSSSLHNQTLESAVATSAIARVARREPVTTTKVQVTFASAYSTGSGNVNAQIG